MFLDLIVRTELVAQLQTSVYVRLTNLGGYRYVRNDDLWVTNTGRGEYHVS